MGGFRAVRERRFERATKALRNFPDTKWASSKDIENAKIILTKTKNKMSGKDITAAFNKRLIDNKDQMNIKNFVSKRLTLADLFNLDGDSKKLRKKNPEILESHQKVYIGILNEIYGEEKFTIDNTNGIENVAKDLLSAIDTVLNNKEKVYPPEIPDLFNLDSNNQVKQVKALVDNYNVYEPQLQNIAEDLKDEVRVIIRIKGGGTGTVINYDTSDGTKINGVDANAVELGRGNPKDFFVGPKFYHYPVKSKEGKAVVDTVMTDVITKEDAEKLGEGNFEEDRIPQGMKLQLPTSVAKSDNTMTLGGYDAWQYHRTGLDWIPYPKKILPVENLSNIFGPARVVDGKTIQADDNEVVFNGKVPGEGDDEEQARNRAVGGLLDKCLGGYNSIITLYGYSGAGKTYTTLKKGEDEGVLIRAIRYLNEADHHVQGVQFPLPYFSAGQADVAVDDTLIGAKLFSYKVAIFEIGMDQSGGITAGKLDIKPQFNFWTYDGMNITKEVFPATLDGNPTDIFNNLDDKYWCSGEVNYKNIKELITTIEQRRFNNTIRSTPFNPDGSSRSHLFIRVQIMKGKDLHGAFVMGDLAGSEDLGSIMASIFSSSVDSKGTLTPDFMSKTLQYWSEISFKNLFRYAYIVDKYGTGEEWPKGVEPTDELNALGYKKAASRKSANPESIITDLKSKMDEKFRATLLSSRRNIKLERVIQIILIEN